MTKDITTWHSQANLRSAENHYSQHIEIKDDPNNTPPTNGEQSNRRLEQTSSSQLPFNETSTRTGERTCTQKLSIPRLEKNDSSSANLWWRKFVQFVKMTKDIDISPMVNSKKILPQYGEQLETKIKVIIIWAIGQNALTEMTKAVRETEPSSLPLHKLYTLFWLHYTPGWNVQHNRSETSSTWKGKTENQQQTPGKESWKSKRSEFEKITAAELPASKFLSLIGKSTGDYEPKKRYEKSTCQ